MSYSNDHSCQRNINHYQFVVDPEGSGSMTKTLEYSIQQQSKCGDVDDYGPILKDRSYELFDDDHSTRNGASADVKLMESTSFNSQKGTSPSVLEIVDRMLDRLEKIPTSSSYLAHECWKARDKHRSIFLGDDEWAFESFTNADCEQSSSCRQSSASRSRDMVCNTFGTRNNATLVDIVEDRALDIAGEILRIPGKWKTTNT